MPENNSSAAYDLVPPHGIEVVYFGAPMYPMFLENR